MHLREQRNLQHRITSAQPFSIIIYSRNTLYRWEVVKALEILYIIIAVLIQGTSSVPEVLEGQSMGGTLVDGRE